MLMAGSVLLPIAVATGATAAVTHGSITANRGANGVTLGMTRAQVIARLGRPVTQAGADLEYAPEPPNGGIGFSVILDGNTKSARARQIKIGGAGFCLAGGGPCLSAKGGFGKLRARYGTALKTVKYESGEHALRLTGRFHSCVVFTDFTPLLSPSLNRSVPERRGVLSASPGAGAGIPSPGSCRPRGRSPARPAPPPTPPS